MNSLQYLPPPWMQYPNIPQGSIGWRMGYGESYSMQYYTWKSTLTTEQAAEYDRLFPEPRCWSLSEWNIVRHGAFWTYKWPIDFAQQQRYLAKENSKFRLFYGHQDTGVVDKACFSQWHCSEIQVGIEHYSCAEQYMMAKKAQLFGDTASHGCIMQAKEQGAIKSFGRKVSNFDSARWDIFKLHIVMTGNYYKFAQHPQLRRFLLSTGSAILAEASPYDTIWGIGLEKNHVDAEVPSKWRGQNLLGFALMEVRQEIQRVWENEHLIDWDFVRT